MSKIMMNWQIDAFTDRAYSGNPAAVVVLPEDRDDKWLQLVAREFNLSETAFLVKRTSTRNGVQGRKGKGLVQVDESGTSLKATKTYTPLREENEFNLRWFTPTVEVDFWTFSDVEIAASCRPFQSNSQGQTPIALYRALHYKLI